MQAGPARPEDVDPLLAVVGHRQAPRLGARRHPRGVDQSPPAAQGQPHHMLRTVSFSLRFV
uniref:Uncharacterized protein n=1 Tax=Anser brachyrhynchus TaxID=132585 RepID=A0A8B9C6L6_9AVES